ncbi:hypothetical protein [Flavobacterium caeni]|uniref:Lipocalin-like domain-containing protein n=1 Tax=Flavobacterium caeni TaxID=490189 RepID=A0A1G5BAT7_9FLAO|nr:hypothetical protein [Flavobacterium caeni]SCX87252.1 hypothetical protein SAMN02927903_00311 [Flavobacterium caeni]
MKTRFLILPALLLVLGTSCNDDDNENYQLPAATLTGKWNYSKTGGIVGGTELLTDYTGNESGCNRDFIELSNDGAYVEVDYDSSTEPCQAITSTGTFAVTGNTVVVDTGDETFTATILNLSYTELKIQDTETGAIVLFVR